ncbi:hypothetical protein AUR04nite_33510 [Glutamicibacter uratoxydans]|uniref:Glycosyl transferase family 1 domain-containing protein n=1 Tax=Glutamicibacter uratoxydans TaxID=43667 RepID=A0A4Y4DR54_GLUUR|nr:glycosyltransferase [Glutamicibacter uratoxydans]GED07819.1 hypothetical protein AUR04nite_33510 [Glutamicibacter uratoxydans]
MLQESTPLDAYMITWAVEREFGGMTTVCLQRAAAFAERYGHASVVTFNPNPDYPTLIQELRRRGKLAASVRHVNLYEHLAEHQLHQLDAMPERQFSPQFQDFTVQSQQYYADAPDSLFSQKFVAGPKQEVSQIRYYRTDGTPYLVDTRFPAEERNRRLMEVFDRSGQITARFFSSPSMYRHWLSALVDHEDAVAVVDSKYTALHLNTWKTTYVPKLYAFHSAHLTAGEDLLTGKLSEAHALIIDQRSNWDGFVFLTQAQRKAYVERFDESAKTFVIPNPIKNARVAPPLPERKAQDLIVAGSLTANKNVQAPVRVVAELKARGLEPVLHIVGKGSQQKALEELAAELGVGSDVIFHGYSDQLPRHFASSTVQLFASKSEGQALVLLEAQLQGCIPVSFNVNFGPADTITDGVNGYLIESGDIMRMADRVEHLMRNPTAAAEMSENCRASASSYVSRDIVALWRDAMIFTSRFKRGHRPKAAPIPEFQAKLQGMEFLEDGRLKLRVEHGCELPEGGVYDLVVVGRDSKKLVAEVTAEDSSATHVSFIVDQSMLAATKVPDSVTDVNLRCVLGSESKMRRLGTPAADTLPYLTAHNNLSFKRSV